MSKPERKRLKLEKTITPTNETLSCVFSSEGCSVYKDRPLMCRLFGTTLSLPCPRGCKPEKLLTQEEEDEIMGIYLKL